MPDQPPQLWRYLPPGEIEVPPEPATETVRRFWHRFAQRLRRHPQSEEPQPEPPPATPPERLPQPDHEAQMRALADALQRLGSPPRVALIDPPGTDTARILMALAERWRLRVLRPGEDAAEATAAPGPLVVPRLERMFLRTPAGLERIRGLLGLLLARPDPVILGSGSWAWRYLDGALLIGLGFPCRLAPAPLEADALRRWLRDGEGEPTFFRHLAAEARGSPGIAAAVWAQAPQPLDWRRVRLPDLPAEPSRDSLLCLHHLLIHGGLEEAVLAELLPFRPVDVALRLRRLAHLGLIERGEEGWRVTHLGYPAVRRGLAAAGFWTDEMRAG